MINNIGNSVLVQGATLADIEAMVNRAIDRRMEAFYKSITRTTPVLIKRKEAAKLLGVSLPTLDAYAKARILHPKHLGGRVFYVEEELVAFRGKPQKIAGEPSTNISPLPSNSHSQDTP